MVATAKRYRATDRLWVCHHDWRLVASWRELDPDVKLVDSTRLRWMKDGAERRAAQLAEAGIDAVNMHVSDWSGGLTTLFHRFERYAFAWDAQFERQLDEVVDMGIDGVFSDHTDRMTGVIAKFRFFPKSDTRSRPRSLHSVAAARTEKPPLLRRSRQVKLQEAELARWPDAHERATDDEVFVDGTEDAAVRRMRAVVAHHENVAGRYEALRAFGRGVRAAGDPAEIDRRRAVGEVGLGELLVVDVDVAAATRWSRWAAR